MKNFIDVTTDSSQTVVDIGEHECKRQIVFIENIVALTSRQPYSMRDFSLSGCAIKTDSESYEWGIKDAFETIACIIMKANYSGGYFFLDFISIKRFFWAGVKHGHLLCESIININKISGIAEIAGDNHLGAKSYIKFSNSNKIATTESVGCILSKIQFQRQHEGQMV